MVARRADVYSILAYPTGVSNLAVGCVMTLLVKQRRKITTKGSLVIG